MFCSPLDDVAADRQNVLNFFWGKARAALMLARILKPNTHDFDILHNVSGVLKPVRANRGGVCMPHGLTCV